MHTPDDVKPYGNAPYVRPRDAATLILLRRKDDGEVLMGRRSASLAFMPGLYVFPGGRMERSDFFAPRDGRLHLDDERRLVSGMGAKGSRQRAEALALASVRETYEETGLLLGTEEPASKANTTSPDWQAFGDEGVVPDLTRIRYLARAITPPGRVRRFDTRFFVATDEMIANGGEPAANPDEELEEVCWVPIRDVPRMKAHPITKSMLSVLVDRLRDDPELRQSPALPFVRVEHRRFVETLE
jgi:8-oxo-dGTP pyrophosphatase MutT (NUDIX family)